MMVGDELQEVVGDMGDAATAYLVSGSGVQDGGWQMCSQRWGPGDGTAL